MGLHAKHLTPSSLDSVAELKSNGTLLHSMMLIKSDWPDNSPEDLIEDEMADEVPTTTTTCSNHPVCIPESEDLEYSWPSCRPDDNTVSAALGPEQRVIAQ